MLQDKGLDEAFWPIFELDEPPKRAWASHWALRLGTVVAVGAACWAVLTYAPETGALHITCLCRAVSLVEKSLDLWIKPALGLLWRLPAGPC